MATHHTITMGEGDSEVTIALPDGRIARLYYHTCPSCSSLDVWTTRGRDVEEISKDTADTTRAPMGLMAWRNGSRPRLEGPAVDGSHGWPAIATASLVWHDAEEGR